MIKEARIGEALALNLKLKRDKEHPDRWQTQWGTKTSVGLYLTIKNQLAELEKAEGMAPAITQQEMTEELMNWKLTPKAKSP